MRIFAILRKIRKSTKTRVFEKNFYAASYGEALIARKKKLAYLIFENGFVSKIPAFFFLPAKSCPTFSAATSPCFCPAFVLPKFCQISDL